ncbi:MAG: potassium channel family protein [Acidobacteriaceae bacterium]
MPDEPQMTVDEARRYLLKWKIAVLVIVLLPLALTIYGLAHPSRHKVLLLVLGMILAPMALAIYINKTGRGGLLKSTSQMPVKDLRSLIRVHPMFIFTLPLLVIGMMWCLLLASLNVAAVEDYKQWLKGRPVTVLFWLLSPTITVSYLCIAIHAPTVGVYIALSIIYMAVGAALYGLQLEGGVVKFFGSYKTQASPLVILTMALFCCLAFGALHYALWTIWRSEYVNLNGAEDAIYFSVVTMTTVGYGDILPVGHLARWLCVAEIVSGVILLVIGVSASMTIWLQTNQPVTEIAKAGPASSETKTEHKPPAPQP